MNFPFHSGKKGARMKIYYDITLKDETKDTSVSYLADSFSIDKNRILKAKSKDCGDITIKIDSNKKLSVRELRIYSSYN